MHYCNTMNIVGNGSADHTPSADGTRVMWPPWFGLKESNRIKLEVEHERMCNQNCSASFKNTIFVRNVSLIVLRQQPAVSLRLSWHLHATCFWWNSNCSKPSKLMCVLHSAWTEVQPSPLQAAAFLLCGRNQSKSSCSAESSHCCQVAWAITPHVILL